MRELLPLGELAVKRAVESGADEAEAYLTGGEEIEVTLESNDIKLVKSQTRDGIGVRAFRDKALGFASVNTLDEPPIEEAARNAACLAKVAPKDEYNRLPEPLPVQKVEAAYDEKARDLGVRDTLRYATEMSEIARSYDPRVTVDGGSFTASIGTRAIANSNGIREEEVGSSFEYFIFGMAVDGDEVSCFDYQYDATRMVAEIDVRKVALEFANNVIGSLGAKRGETFKGTALLSPDAVHQLLVWAIGSSVNADNVQKGMSKWTGKLGRQVASQMLTVEDNGLIPGGVASSSFDREGVPHTPLKIIQKGVLTSYLYNTYTAGKDKRASTGHASGETRGVPRIDTTNLMIKQGDKAKDELIGEIKKGVLVTRFSGFPNAVTGDFSGVVKGGFLIEDGEIRRPVIETLIAGNVFELLPRISGISKERKKIHSLITPYISIEDVSVTGG